MSALWARADWPPAELFCGPLDVFWGPNFVLDVRAEAKDQKGNQALHFAELSSQPMGENVLLRLDKAIYQAGDSVTMFRIDTSTGKLDLVGPPTPAGAKPSFVGVLMLPGK